MSFQSNQKVLPLTSLFVLKLFFLFSSIDAHQSVSFPYPISHDVACRISSKQNCPGPCPRTDLREDMTPNNPSVTVRRGDWLPVNVLANNHRGGFNSWTLVQVRDMYSKYKHMKNTFLWTCADVGVSKCSTRNKKRDCRFDVRNDYFHHKIQIPKIYPDGVYVLGWTWYGGGKEYGSFGDYYDCIYIKIKGGPTEYAHRPNFKPGQSETGGSGLCRSTVNKLGVCWREPCPGGGRPTSLMMPAEFDNGKQPDLIHKSSFTNPYNPKVRNQDSPYVQSMTIRSAIHPNKVYSVSTKNKYPYILLTKSTKVTVTCEVSGHVRFVVFYSNGRKGNVDTTPPYTIAGDWIEHKSGKVQYAPWKHDIDRDVTTISCRAVGYDDTEHFANVELSTAFY